MRPRLCAAAAAAGITAAALMIAGCGDSTPSAATTPPPASTSPPDRSAADGTMIPLTVRNATDRPVTLKVTKVDNHDWTSPRPDWTRDGTQEHPDEKGGFQGTLLGPGEKDKRVLGINPYGTVFFEMEFIVRGDQDPPVVRLRKTVFGSSPKPRRRGVVSGPHGAIGWASSDSKGRTCRAVTKSFAQDNLKVTMECDLSGDDPSLVTIENL